MRRPFNHARQRYAAPERNAARCRDNRFRDELETPYLLVEPSESEFGAEAFERVVFDDDVYNALSMSIHGRRLWDSAEEREVDE